VSDSFSQVLTVNWEELNTRTRLRKFIIFLFALIVAASTSFIMSSLASQGAEEKGFQGWIKTYCLGNQTIDPTLVDYGSCSTDDAYYHVAAPGVRYKVLREGSGRTSRNGDVVFVEYLGWVFDKDAAYARGVVIDTTYTDGYGSFEFVLGDKKVIPGWEHGVNGMKQGEVRELIIDPTMAYGDRAIGDQIPPGSTLIFEVELLEFGCVE